MKNPELIFIPNPVMSHLISAVEMAKILLERDSRIAITLLIMKLPNDMVVENYTQKLSAATDPSSRLRIINLPGPDGISSTGAEFVFDFIESQVSHVRHILSNFSQYYSSDRNTELAGIVVDMTCTSFIDVANEFGLPFYIYCVCGATCLALFLHLVQLELEHDDQDFTLLQYKNSDATLLVPCFSNPLPAKVLPHVFVDDGHLAKRILSHCKNFYEAKGILVNTFYELESYAIQSMSKDGRIPKLYPVGPILNLNGTISTTSKNKTEKVIIEWLDNQPDCSVVFLCFGSYGSFDDCQVKEIANAIEHSGQRFLWSLRMPPSKDSLEPSKAYNDLKEVLPDGFLERTKGIGKVIGWAPQVAVLSHRAVGGFVSHCGWNSTVESIWCGVPMATWPMFGEQQMNAFLLVKELGLAEAIRIDYLRDVFTEHPVDFVRAEVIERGILRLMEENGNSEIRHKVKEMKKKCRMTVLEGGSSYTSQTLFIEDVISSIAYKD